MKKTLIAALSLSGVVLVGCVAVPVYEEPVGYYAPPPSVSFSYYGSYGPRHHHYRHHRHRHRYNRAP